MHCFERRLAGSQVVDDEILKMPSFDLFYFSEFFEYYKCRKGYDTRVYKLGNLGEAALGFMRICAKIQTSKNGLGEEGWICTFKELK